MSKHHKSDKSKSPKADNKAAKTPKAPRNLWETPVTEALRWKPGLDVSALDYNTAPGFKGDRAAGEAALAAVGEELADLQERLFANRKSDPPRSVLLVLQGLDAAGKGGAVKHAIGLVDPEGVMIHGFGTPTAEEAKHGYLWRIRNALPKPGYIGVFDRSHYEQVLIVRVDGLEPEKEWRGHYAEIRDFEKELVAGGTKIVKICLMVSPDEQKARFAARLADPAKYWKYNPGDLDTRSKLPQYLEAYNDLLAETDADDAPWYVVPADKKWYARLAITELLLEALRSLDLQWPPATFDVEEQKALVAAL